MDSPSRKFSKIAPAPKDSPLATQVIVTLQCDSINMQLC